MKDRKIEKTERIDFSAIEKKWQDSWEKKKCFKVSEKSKRKKCYVLEMYPYPSASFLHMGHVRNFTIGDVYARFKRMSGFNVLYPMGYDSFGLPAETAAKKAGIHPKKYTGDAISKITDYFRALGNSYDWTKTLASHEPEYYKWNQYFFIKLFEKGLAYRKKAPVNWCENCQSVLANEEAEGGKCWRCDKEVVKKELGQWFFKITDYSDKLLADLDKIEWPEKIKTMQKNWIGKSCGTEIDFEIKFDNKREIQAESVEYFRKNISIDSKLNRKGKEFKIKEIVNFRFDDGNCYTKLFLENGFVLADDGNTNSFVFVKENKNNLNIKEGNIDFNKKKFSYLFKAHAVAEEIFGEEIFKKGEGESFWDYSSKDGEYLSLGIIDKTKKRLDFFGETIYSKDIKIIKDNEKWPIFTTRPDTLYGVTFMVVSALHPKLMSLVSKEKKIDAEEFVKRCKKARSHEEIESLEKEGVFTGSYAINPLTKEKIPVYAGNFVVADYGSGMIMAVPAHDQRDFEFAKKYKIPIEIVIQPNGQKLNEKTMKEAYVEEGILINSDKFSGVESRRAIGEITNLLESKKLGKKTINYKIRDWLISRQRYWGTPIPIVYCDKCGIVPVPEKDLPVLLPEKVDFKVAGNPLASNKEFLKVKCPKCGDIGKRETDTMGGFVDSSWYFLRYCDNMNKKKPFDEEKVNYWMPVDQYVGGAEHAVMHLMYARFFVKALKDLGFVKFDEPFKKLFNQGIVYKDGAKMSKSQGNVVYQTDISNKYGIDTARLFLMLVSSPDKQMGWSDNGVEGAFRIINRLARLQERIKKESTDIEDSKINSTIKKVTDMISGFEYPKAIISIVECIDRFSESISKKNYEILLKLISPFCPHICEELWEKTGGKGFISLSDWPVADEKKINEKLEQEEKNVSKLIEDILNIVRIIKERDEKDMKKAYLYTIPPELKMYKDNLDLINKKTGLEIKIFAVNDKSKIDPENKAEKAKPGKPAIYLE